MKAPRHLSGLAVLWLALGAAELALSSGLDADALAAAMTAQRPSASLLGGLALVLLRVARFVVVPSVAGFLLAQAWLTPTEARPPRSAPHSTGHGP